jgi:hypothetical protein
MIAEIVATSRIRAITTSRCRMSRSTALACSIVTVIARGCGHSGRMDLEGGEIAAVCPGNVTMAPTDHVLTVTLGRLSFVVFVTVATTLPSIREACTWKPAAARAALRLLNVSLRDGDAVRAAIALLAPSRSDKTARCDSLQ